MLKEKIFNISEEDLKISKGNYLPTVTISGSKSQENTSKLTNRTGVEFSQLMMLILLLNL